MKHHLSKHFSPYVEKFEKQDKQTRIALIVATFGILLFFIIAITIPFRNTLFQTLFPKDPSKAQEADTFQVEESLVTPVSITASANEPQNPAANAIDGNEETFWNSGQYPYQWVELDLGKPYHISSIWLKIKQFENFYEGNEFPSRHLIFAGPTPNPQDLVDDLEQKTRDGDWLETYYDPSLENVRYIRILTIGTNSLVAWNEIQVYSPDVVGEEQSLTPAPSGSLTASPNPCSIPQGVTTCKSILNWSTENAANVRLMYSVNGKEELLSTNPSGSQYTPVVTTQGTTFTLYSDTQILSQITVTGRMLPTPTPVDVTVPVVRITAPKTGAVVQPRSTMQITANASGISGISKVEFLTDRDIICTDSTSPYVCSWQVPNLSGSRYNLRARVYDKKGKVGLSEVVAVSTASESKTGSIKNSGNNRR